MFLLFVANVTYVRCSMKILMQHRQRNSRNDEMSQISQSYILWAFSFCNLRRESSCWYFKIWCDWSPDSFTLLSGYEPLAAGDIFLSFWLNRKRDTFDVITSTVGLGKVNFWSRNITAYISDLWSVLFDIISDGWIDVEARFGKEFSSAEIGNEKKNFMISKLEILRNILKKISTPDELRLMMQCRSLNFC